MADFRMAKLTATKTDGNLYFVPLFNEALRLRKLGVKIVYINVQPQADLFKLDGTLVLSGFLLPF